MTISPVPLTGLVYYLNSPGGQKVPHQLLHLLKKYIFIYSAVLGLSGGMWDFGAACGI